MKKDTVFSSHDLAFLLIKKTLQSSILYQLKIKKKIDKDNLKKKIMKGNTVAIHSVF
jgi:hypothetical protein